MTPMAMRLPYWYRVRFSAFEGGEQTAIVRALMVRKPQYRRWRKMIVERRRFH